MESVPSSLVIPSSEPSGTVLANEGKEPVASPNPTTLTHPTSPDSEALDSLQVIELQTFIERKAWIEEKIKFLEKLPAIEVFVGIEALRSSAEEVPGLPTRPQLQQWLAEHEIIEKETEIFDTGELKKLRKFTRAATQRNLSPQDTDLIELTLTTIYELDKLLHLLRDRSENLDLLGVRLTWEECRIASWVSRRQVIQDLKNFLETRARWSPSVYDHTPQPAETNTLGPTLTVRRKGSAASLASAVSEAVLLAPGFSRTARFTQAELLSRDSAQFAARVTSLRHGSIANAGKILDKLIDHSRRPVPEELLDEQDRLEEQGIAHMEHIGKFVMNVVMQWRKADETYVETVKDQMAAKILLDDIDAAKTQHPTVRQSLSFTSRADTLRKRLAIRGDPTARGSTFPCPVHPLFPEQHLFNQSLIQNLSSEIAAALATVKSAEAAAAAYRSGYEAVKAFEGLVESGKALTTQFKDIVDRLETGVPADNGDGSPPNLTSEACLNVSAHSVFLALMPTTFRELGGLKRETSQLLRSFPAAVLRLTAPGVDPEFRQDGLNVMEGLRQHQENADRVRAEVSARVDRMREARRLKALMDEQTSSTLALIKDMATSMEQHRWQPVVRRDGAPPTPESPPSIPLPALPLNTDFQQQIDDAAATITRTIHTPLLALLDTLEKPLNTSLRGSYDALNDLVHRARQNMTLLTSIQTQSAAMQSIKDEVDAWRMHIEDLKVRYDSAMQDLSDPAAFEEAQTELAASHDKLRADVLSFINLLPTRVQFIERTHKSSPSSEHLAHAPSNDTTTIHDDHTAIPRSLDDAVRHDCNDFAMRLNGDLRGLEQKANHLSLTRLAREVDDCLATTVAGLTEASQQLSGLKAAQQNIAGEEELHVALTQLVTDVEAHSQTLRRRISQSFSPTRDLLREMSDSPGVHDPPVHESLFLARQRRQDDAELRFATWDEQVKTLLKSVIDAQRLESKRLEELRLAEAARVKAEQERLAEEAIQRQREEEARVLALEVQKAEEERQARLKAEESERARLESERLLAEEKTRQLEREREKAENARRSEEQRNLEALELEKQAMQMKLRRAEDELAAERQAQADRIAQELQTRLQAEADAQAKPMAFPTKDESSTEDVFGLKLNTSDMHQHKSQEIIDLQVRILNLRKRIRAMSLVTLSRATAASAALPTSEELENLNGEFVAICKEVSLLPSTINDQSAQVELDSLKHEVDVSIDSMERLRALAVLTDAIVACDAALSDLLEHIDSFPSIPVGPLATSYQPDVSQSADEQMKGRLGFTKASMDLLGTAFRAVSDDPRASSEHQRVLQTWSELQDMAQDRISGKKSRPSSATISSGPSTGRNSRTSTVSGRNSRTSLSNMPPPKVLGGPTHRKSGTYANLSVSSRGRGGLAVPSPSRRTVSTSSERTPSRMSISSSRSASGPIGFSVYGSTFASRQRTTSLTPSATPPRRPSATLLPRMQTPTFRRGTASPSISELSSTSNMTSSRLSTSTSSWSRAPRMSLPRSTPPRKAVIPRKTYVANPKSKLDVAVGDVVNNLPVGINVEGVSGSWKDQSGKYWIGDQDPRLCFCRILRSQTVMVRVGGGWQELSKFIRGHFADSFRLMPDSPKTGAREERWISSATLAEAVEIASSAGSPPHPPRTPEPRGSFLPSFALSTPSGHSPRSLRSTPSSKGSPLTPLQFMRRAEPESPFAIRPATPSKAPIRSRTIPPSTPIRNSVWRP